jgi:hypothetical protein
MAVDVNSSRVHNIDGVASETEERERKGRIQVKSQVYHPKYRRTSSGIMLVLLLLRLNMVKKEKNGIMSMCSIRLRHP